MKNESYLLGLFYADEDNLVFDKVKFSENLNEERIEALKMLSFRFLGPVFLTAAIQSEIGNNWQIKFIEASLSILNTDVNEVDVLQSFFNLNSSIETLEGTTNLFAMISSPFTEDVKLIYDEISEYIHPSIIQGKVVNENLLGRRFNFERFIAIELQRGINLIEYSQGSFRKAYWEEK